MMAISTIIGLLTTFKKRKCHHFDLYCTFFLNRLARNLNVKGRIIHEQSELAYDKFAY